MDFEQIYKLKVIKFKEPIFIVSSIIFFVWNIQRLLRYTGCFNLSENVCPTIYLYIPVNNYKSIGTLEFFVLLALIALGLHSAYQYIKEGKLSWLTLIVWGISLTFLKYFITVTTLF